MLARLIGNVSPQNRFQYSSSFQVIDFLKYIEFRMSLRRSVCFNADLSDIFIALMSSGRSRHNTAFVMRASLASAAVWNWLEYLFFAAPVSFSATLGSTINRQFVGFCRIFAGASSRWDLEWESGATNSFVTFSSSPAHTCSLSKTGSLSLWRWKTPPHHFNSLIL